LMSLCRYPLVYIHEGIDIGLGMYDMNVQIISGKDGLITHQYR